MSSTYPKHQTMTDAPAAGYCRRWKHSALLSQLEILMEREPVQYGTLLHCTSKHIIYM